MIPEDNGFRTVEYVSTHDGDTFTGRLVTLKVKAETDLAERHIRVHGWNAAELREAEGPYMRQAFEQILLNAKRITVLPVSRSFERIVCDVYVDGILFLGQLQHTLTMRRLADAGKVSG